MFYLFIFRVIVLVAAVVVVAAAPDRPVGPAESTLVVVDAAVIVLMCVIPPPIYPVASAFTATTLSSTRGFYSPRTPAQSIKIYANKVIFKSP